MSSSLPHLMSFRTGVLKNWQVQLLLELNWTKIFLFACFSCNNTIGYENEKGMAFSSCSFGGFIPLFYEMTLLWFPFFFSLLNSLFVWKAQYMLWATI